ncbi:Exosome component 10 [Glugoides intestinalis]
MLVDLVAEFVKTLNTAIVQVDTRNREHIMLLEQLKDKIKHIMGLCERSEEIISSSLAKIEESVRECNDIVYIRKDNKIRAIVSRDVLKPVIMPIEKQLTECTCLFELPEYVKEYEGYTIIDTEETLRKMDKTLSTTIVAVFDHDYRSFEGFTCYIALFTLHGQIYIIDAIKFRGVIPQLRLLKCGVKKIFCSQMDVERLIKDFGHIGCYQNYNVPEPDVFIDWRIRPFNSIIGEIICAKLFNTVEKLNKHFLTERHIITEKNEISEFIDLYNIEESLLNIAVDLLNLRVYLAKKNNESLQYIITNPQLYTLLVKLPKNMLEFEALFSRMSPVLRLHANDFLIVLNRGSKEFSLENLKSALPIELPSANINNIAFTRYRSFE